MEELRNTLGCIYAIHHYTVPAILKISAETNTTDIPIIIRSFCNIQTQFYAIYSTIRLQPCRFAHVHFFDYGVGMHIIGGTYLVTRT